MNIGKRFLSDLKLHSDYLRWSDTEGRYETWDEACDEIIEQHRIKYKNFDIEEELDFALEHMKRKEVLASQRNLQFRGQSVFKHNARLYNCSSTYIDRPEVFKQIMYLLLCGCGVGYSVEKRFVEKLPSVKERLGGTVTYQIPDSIEGWAMSLGNLIGSYFDGSDAIRFDYSLIRDKGSLIDGKFLAPGHEPLKRSLEIIETILEKKEKNTKLTPLECHDIICHASDAVLSAGLRRSALICLFDKDDKEMVECKTGNWFTENPQRARSNNSVKLVEGQYTKEEYDYFSDKIKQFGEPGFALVKDDRFCTNPCQPKWATVLTPDGIRTIEEINIGDSIWSIEGWCKVVNKWSTGVKDVYSYKTTSGEFVGTENHKLVSNSEKIEAKDCESIDSLTGEVESVTHNINIIMDGLVLGDGGVHKASNDLVLLYIGENDVDYFDSEISPLIKRERKGVSPYAWEIDTQILPEELKSMEKRYIPERYFKGTSSEVASFLRGLYSANGSVVSNRITYKTSSKTLRDQLQIMLSSLGIKSYFTTNKAKEVEFSNGVYECKESYDINISTDRHKFVKLIGFIQKYKNEKIDVSKSGKAKINYPIQEIKYINTEEVFDLTVDNESHTYWTGGVNVSNCFEISFIPINPKNGRSCVSFCNLNEINGSGIKTKEQFMKRVKAATIIGTLQSGYTDFPFLGEDTEELVRWESLLGLSITGWFDNPLLFNRDWLKDGANYAKEVNKELASKIGINQSARLTCTKPSGNASVVLGTSSGIHPAHSKKYFRVMQINKSSDVARWVRDNKPDMIEESVWSANGTDECIYVPIEESERAITKDDVTSIEFLEKIKMAQECWVLEGANKNLGYSKYVNHNISNTVIVEDWKEVLDYIYDNRQYFCGISFLPKTGDKVYKQAPFTKVLDGDELHRKYGDAAFFSSGLIVDLLHTFGGDLWDACEAITNDNTFLTGGNVEVTVKKEMIKRGKKFAKNYLLNDLNLLVECLKDVHLYHRWCSIKRNFKSHIKLEQILGKPSYLSANEMGAVACHGGSCEI